MADIRLSSQDLSIVGSCVKRVVARNTEVEAKKSEPRKSSRAINITTKIPISLDLAIASKNNTTALQRFPQFLKAGTVYKLKWGLRVGVKICLKYMYDCIAFERKQCVNGFAS